MNQDPSYPNFRHALLLVVVAVLLQIAVGVPLAVLGLALRLRIIESPWGLGAMNLIAFGLVLAWGRWKTGVPWRTLYPLRLIPLAAWPSVLVSQAGMLMVGSELDNCVRYLLPPPAFVTELFAQLQGSGDAWLGPMFTLVLVAPITEEFLFRGLILRGLMRRGSVTSAVLLSAFLFGLMHLNPWQSFTTMIMGVLLAWWTVRTRSLLPALAAHAWNNSGVLWNQHLPFQIPGFNDAAVMAAATRFQPWWFDLLGVALMVGGTLWFRRAVAGFNAGPPEEPEPPVPMPLPGGSLEVPPVIASDGSPRPPTEGEASGTGGAGAEPNRS